MILKLLLFTYLMQMAAFINAMSDDGKLIFNYLKPFYIYLFHKLKFKFFRLCSPRSTLFKNVFT